MYKDRKDILTLTNKLSGKGLVLSLWSDDTARIERFKDTAYLNLEKSLNWFHQCDAKEYQMFEFWISPSKLDLVRENAQQVAAKMKMNLEIDVAEENFLNPA